MAVITTPAIQLQNFDISLERANNPLEKLDGSEVILASTSARWNCSFRLTPGYAVDHREWFAALAQLSKLTDVFHIPLPAYTNGAGYSGGNVLINGVDQLGTSLIMDSATLNTQVFEAGDYFHIPGIDETKIVTADASLDGSGDMTVNFEPALRQSPADNQVIEITAPELRNMRLVAPVAQWGQNASKIFNIDIRAIESY